jgi:hypothetical protein
MLERTDIEFYNWVTVMYSERNNFVSSEVSELLGRDEALKEKISSCIRVLTVLYRELQQMWGEAVKEARILMDIAKSCASMCEPEINEDVLKKIVSMNDKQKHHQDEERSLGVKSKWGDNMQMTRAVFPSNVLSMIDHHTRKLVIKGFEKEDDVQEAIVETTTGTVSAPMRRILRVPKSAGSSKVIEKDSIQGLAGNVRLKIASAKSEAYMELEVKFKEVKETVACKRRTAQLQAMGQDNLAATEQMREYENLLNEVEPMPGSVGDGEINFNSALYLPPSVPIKNTFRLHSEMTVDELKGKCVASKEEKVSKESGAKVNVNPKGLKIVHESPLTPRS